MRTKSGFAGLFGEWHSCRYHVLWNRKYWAIFPGWDTFSAWGHWEKRLSWFLVHSSEPQRFVLGQMTLLWVINQWWVAWRADGEFNATSAAQSCVWLMSMQSSEKVVGKGCSSFWIAFWELHCLRCAAEVLPCDGLCSYRLQERSSLGCHDTELVLCGITCLNK